MVYLFPALIMFIVIYGIHVAWWRIRRPFHQKRMLVVLMLLGAILIPVLLGLLKEIPVRPGERVYGAALFVLLWVSYLVTYSALEEDSPTLSLLRFISQYSRPGPGWEDLLRAFRASSVIAMRIQAAAGEGMLVVDDGRVLVTAKGRWIATLFQWCQRLWKLPVGG